MKVGTPYKNFSLDDITQRFHDGHKAIDSVENRTVSLYGTPMCAMEDGVIEATFRTDGITKGDTDNMEKGYGIDVRGDSGNKYRYWHILPHTPVSKGERVKQGQIICYMGNSGTVYSLGQYVPLVNRLLPNRPGTHLHLVTWVDGKIVDPLTIIDFTQQPNYTKTDELGAMLAVMGKIAKVLN